MKPANPPHAFAPKPPPATSSTTRGIKGKVVLFKFWTTWCKHCEGEAELVDDIAKEFSDKGLIVLAVDVLEPD